MPAPIIRAPAISEMKLLTPAEHGIADLPEGLQVRSWTDPQGRNLIVINNQAHRAFSIPAELVKNPLPDWFLNRVRTL